MGHDYMPMERTKEKLEIEMQANQVTLTKKERINGKKKITNLRKKPESMSTVRTLNTSRRSSRA